MVSIIQLRRSHALLSSLRGLQTRQILLRETPTHHRTLHLTQHLNPRRRTGKLDPPRRKRPTRNTTHPPPPPPQKPPHTRHIRQINILARLENIPPNRRAQ